MDRERQSKKPRCCEMVNYFSLLLVGPRLLQNAETQLHTSSPRVQTRGKTLEVFAFADFLVGGKEFPFTSRVPQQPRPFW